MAAKMTGEPVGRAPMEDVFGERKRTISRIVGHVSAYDGRSDLTVENLDRRADFYREREAASRRRAKIPAFIAALLRRDGETIKRMTASDGWLGGEIDNWQKSADRNEWIKRKTAAMQIEAERLQKEMENLRHLSWHDEQSVDSKDAAQAWGCALADEKAAWNSFVSAAVDSGYVLTDAEVKARQVAKKAEGAATRQTVHDEAEKTRNELEQYGVATPQDLDYVLNGIKAENPSFDEYKTKARAQGQARAFEAWRNFCDDTNLRLPREMASRLKMFKNWGDTDGRVKWGCFVDSVSPVRFNQMWKSYERRH